MKKIAKASSDTATLKGYLGPSQNFPFLQRYADTKYKAKNFAKLFGRGSYKVKFFGPKKKSKSWDTVPLIG